MFKQKLIISAILTLPFFSTDTFAQTPKKIKTIIVDAGHGGHDGGAHGGYEGGLNSYEKNVTLAISNKLVEELKKQLPDVKIVPTRTTDIYQAPPEKADIANANKGDLFICIHADAVALQTGRRLISTHLEIRHKVTWIGKGRKKKKQISSYNVEVPVYQYYKIPSQRSGTSIWLFAPHKTDAKTKAIMGDTDFIAQTSAGSNYDSIDFSTPEKRVLADIYAARYQTKSIILASYVNEEIAKTGREALGINQRQKGIWVLQATHMPAILVETGFISNSAEELRLRDQSYQHKIAIALFNGIRYYQKKYAAAGI